MILSLQEQWQCFSALKARSWPFRNRQPLPLEPLAGTDSTRNIGLHGETALVMRESKRAAQ